VIKVSKIKRVHARQILDTKCRPILEVDIETTDGVTGRGSAPTGTSVGMYEAYVLRDDNPNEYFGMSVHKAIDKVNKTIAPALIGMDVSEQRAIDECMIALDNTPNKSKLGGNAIYSVSIAALRAAAASEGVEVYRHICGRDIKTVPVPSFNVINGGKYADLVQPFNEFLIVPYNADTIAEAVEIAVKCFKQLEATLTDYLSRGPTVAGSYGWAAPSADPDIVLGLMSKAVNACGYANKIAFALDCASSEMYDAKTDTYLLHGKRVSADELIAYTKTLCQKYPMVFIEDLLDENDWENYSKATRELTNTIMIGDDLVVSDINRLKRAYETKAVEGFVLKPNQVGTITEALDTYAYAKAHNIYTVPSGRSGGIVGDIIMDFSVGLEVDFQKNGAPRTGERIEKLNFLLRANDLTPGCRLADLSEVVRF